MSAESLAYATVRSSRENLRKGVARGQIREENATVSTESLYEVNTYYTKIKDGRLISPDTGLPLIQSFRDVTELDHTEISFFKKCEDWAVNPDEAGTAIWVSPPHQDHKGDDTKVIAFKKVIFEDQPAILNRSINLQLHGNEFLNLGFDMIQHSTQPGRIIFDPEVLRGELIVLPDDNQWIDVVEHYTRDQELIGKIRSDQDIFERQGKLDSAEVYIRMIEAGYSDQQIVEQMIADNFINPIGGRTCDLTSAQTVSGYFGRNSIQYGVSGEKKFVKNCGNCGKEINDYIGAGYVCSRCNGVYEGC